MELQWELMVFTLFMCLAAGTFAMQGMLSFLGKGSRLQMPALVLSAAALVVGGVGSFLHLQHWERIFNGFGHLTSGITQEFIAIIVFALVLVGYFVLLRKTDNGLPPRWMGILAVVVSAALVIVMSHSYNMAARPVWDTPLLWLYYLANAALYGALGVAAIAGAVKDGAGNAALLAKASLACGIVQALVTAAYAAYFSLVSSSFTDVGYYFDPTHPTKAMADPSSQLAGVIAGDQALLFWLCVVAVGIAIPLVIAYLMKRAAVTDRTSLVLPYAAVALLCALAGGLCFRVILYLLGFSVFVFY